MAKEIINGMKSKKIKLELEENGKRNNKWCEKQKDKSPTERKW